MGRLITPEFQTAGDGYSPDRFYVSTRLGPEGEGRWISLNKVRVPAEFLYNVEDLIHERKFPAYRSVADFMRDALVHHLHTRLEEITDPDWKQKRDHFFLLVDVERIQVEQDGYNELVSRWTSILRDAKRSELRAIIVRAVEHLDGLRGDWREDLAGEITRAERNL